MSLACDPGSMRLLAAFRASRRQPALQVAKSAVATISAWLIAGWLIPGPLPVFAAIAALLLLSPAGAAAPRAGSIRGRVAVPDAPAAGPRPGVAELSTRPHDHVDRRRCVVYLESAPTLAFAELKPGRARMDQRGEQFAPRVLAITAGTVVEGTVDHTMAPGSSILWASVPGALARVVTYDSRGSVVDDHSLRDCTGGVDCEVR